MYIKKHHQALCGLSDAKVAVFTVMLFFLNVLPVLLKRHSANRIRLKENTFLDGIDKRPSLSDELHQLFFRC